MKYLQIKNSSDPQIIGTTNGVYQVEIDEGLLLENENYHEIESVFLSPFSDITRFNYRALKLNCKPIQAQLVKKAVLTDLMGFSPYFLGCSYMISLKFLECLQEFGLDDDKFNLLPVNINGVDSLVYILFVPMIPIESINFEESILVDSSNPYERKTVSINSYQEFKNYQESGVYFDFNKVCIPKEFQNDCVLSFQAESNLFLSEELIRFLMTKDVSSFEISNSQTELRFG